MGWICNPTTDICTFDSPPANGAAIQIKEFATSDIAATDVWAIGAWNGEYGYPGEVEFFGDRLCLAATIAQPQTVWMSRTGDYSFFGRSTPIADDDPITATLNARGLNQILDLVPLANIAVLTSGSEWKSSVGEGEIISPTTMGFKPQTHIGASNLQALVIGASAIFPQAKGDAVLELAYDTLQEGYVGGDLMSFSAHLLEGYTLQAWAWQQVPYSAAFAVRDDGILLSMTYKKEQQVVGWMHHDTAEGEDEIEDVVQVPEDKNAIYIVVKRTINGQVKRYIERMADAVRNVVDYVGLDSALTFDGRNATATTISLSVIGPGGWTPDDLVLATASSAIFAAGDVDDRLVFGYSDAVPTRLTIEEYVDSTHVRCRPMAPIPTAYQAGATSWAFARDTIGNLGHLEGREVYALADGYVQGPFTVAGAEIRLSPPGVVAHVGIAFDCDLETLDVNIVGGESVAGRTKLIRKVFAQIRGRDIRAGMEFDDTKLREYKPRNNEQMGELPRERVQTIEIATSGEWSTNGRLCIRHGGILPLEILSLTPDTQFGE